MDTHIGASTVTVPLTTGELTIEVLRADWPFDRLCTFAARNNPRRGFLVVSKVLGRHIGAKPSDMRATFRDLAAKIPADVPGPVIVVGLAETAICLGQGVHEEFGRRTGREDLLFLPSTRQQLDHPLLCRFEEPHSHASTHLVYRPEDFADRFAAARTLVMVDDEISTGTTLSNLAAAIVGAVPTIERMVAVTLADWSAASDWRDRTDRPMTVESLLQGRLRWTAGPGTVAPAEDTAFDATARSLGAMAVHHNFGRLGRADVADEGDPLADTIVLPPGSRLRVVGTGEFTYPTFRLAERLEANGHDVVVQSTTRSPARLDGAIRTMLQFADNYGTGVANYLYNVDPDDQRMTIICHETPPGSIDPALIAALDARTLHFAGTR